MRRAFARLDMPVIMGTILVLNGFLNIATGAVPVFAFARYVNELSGFLQVAPVLRTSGMVSILLGILLLAIGKGLFERRRAAWKLALLVLVLLMANNLYRGTTPQTAFVSGALVIGLLVFRKRFNVPGKGHLSYGQVLALGSVLFALAYGIMGSYALRAEFDGIATWTDAVYYTFVTYSTLGYGDIVPVTQNARLFATTMVPIGLASFITALTVLVGPAIERHVKGVFSIMERLHGSGNHVVVCGYSNVTESAIDELRARDMPYVIVDEREDLILHLREKGHDVLAGNPTRRDTLEQANLRAAAAIICGFDSDATNVLVALTARQLRDSAEGARFRILVRIEDEENIPKARQAGADEVISPSTSAGRALATKALEKGELDT